MTNVIPLFKGNFKFWYARLVVCGKRDSRDENPVTTFPQSKNNQY